MILCFNNEVIVFVTPADFNSLSFQSATIKNLIENQTISNSKVTP